jgi:catechol 2,3-dioxygenase-like lactoylglutathione lyase family enzyme
VSDVALKVPRCALLSPAWKLLHVHALGLQTQQLVLVCLGLSSLLATVERMTIQRMDHVGIVVEDLAAARAFFVELGLEPRGEASVEGGWVDRVVGLEGVRADIAMMATPDGHGRVELAKFHAPPGQGGDGHAPANAPGIRHLSFAVEDIDAVVAGLRARDTELVGEVVRYRDSYRLCYVRGPEGIIVELAERIG